LYLTFGIFLGTCYSILSYFSRIKSTYRLCFGPSSARY